VQEFREARLNASRILLKGMNEILPVFSRFRLLAENDCQLRHVRLSARNISRPSGRIFMKLDMVRIFQKSIDKILSFIKI